MIESFGERVKRLRSAKGMRQIDLASACGTTRDAVGCWEIDKSWPRVPDLPRLASALGVSTDHLITGGGPDDAMRRAVNTLQESLLAMARREM